MAFETMKNLKKCQPSLPDAEWMFHKVEPEERSACLWHERIRGKGQRPVLYWWDKPWLELSGEEKKFQMSLLPPHDSRPSSIRRVQPAKAKSSVEELEAAIQRYTGWLVNRDASAWKFPVEVLHLELDWRISNTKLTRDFAEFIRNERGDFFSVAAMYKRIARKTGTGRRRDVERRLVDIAIVRADAARFTRPGVFALLTPLLHKFGFTSLRAKENEGLFSDKNWRTTVRKATESMHP